MLITDILNEYHNWMLDKMQANLPEHRNYDLLLKQLDSIPFIVIHPLDENRNIDGKILREEFLEEEGISHNHIWHDDSSVLEVLVALSMRIETEITGEPGNDHLDRWFWVMIHNLGLDYYRNNMYDPDKINEIIDIWLKRKYKSNGKNGVFPLQKTDIDQREIDIWYQMQLYLTENYRF